MQDLYHQQYYPKGPCAQIAYSLALNHLYTDYFTVKVYTI